MAAGCSTRRAATGPAASVSARPRARPGTVLWRASLPGPPVELMEAAGVLCAAMSAGLVALSASDGKQAWSLGGHAAPWRGIGTAGGLLIGNASPLIGALDPATGHQKWKLELPATKGLLAWTPAIGYSQDAIYASV